MRGRVQLDGVNCPPCATRKQFMACFWPFLSWFYDYNEVGITYGKGTQRVKLRYVQACVCTIRDRSRPTITIATTTTIAKRQ